MILRPATIAIELATFVSAPTVAQETPSEDSGVTTLAERAVPAPAAGSQT